MTTARERSNREFSQTRAECGAERFGVHTPRAVIGELNTGNEDARAVRATGNDATHFFSPTALGDGLLAEYLVRTRIRTGDGAMSGQLQTPPQGGAYNIDIDELVDRMASIAVLLDKQYEATRRGELSLIARRALSVVARKENLSVNRVAAEIGRAQSTTSELLARLLKQKLIEQERGKTDGRMVLLRVTDKGRNVLQEVHERRAASWGELLKRLEPVDRTSLVAAMMAVCDALDNE